LTINDRASTTRRERRLRGRPPKEPYDDPDQLTIDLVAALQDAWKISERKAFDLAICWLEAREVPATKVPRGKHPAGSILVGYERWAVDGLRTFAGRASTLRQKSRRAPPRRHVVQVLSLALRCKDIATVHRLFDQLVGLASVTGHERLRQVIDRLIER
jgi:hypothetical protein